MMRRNKRINIYLLLITMVFSLLLVGVLSACNKGDIIPFVVEEKKVGPQFLEGAQEEIFVNDTVVLSEYIEYVSGVDYSILIKDEEGNTQDITREIIWSTENPGNYTIVYTIKEGEKKGTNEFILKVSFPELSWDFTLQNLPYVYGDTLVFEDYFSEMNIYASLENYTVIMDSVEVDGNIIDLTKEESYTFNSMSDHVFKFHIESSDGQKREGREVISIKYIDEDYLRELEDMGISIYGDLYVQEGNYTMIAGSFCNGNNVWLRRENGPHNLPYIAYNGSYGSNSYVKVDFTGNNLPIFSFFRDENYSKSIFDGTKGVILTGGFTNNSGKSIHDTMCSRFTMYGPYMLHEYDRGASDTTNLGSMAGTIENPYPGSFRSLDENTQYRIIIGPSGIRKGRANLIGTITPVDTLFLQFDCVIINLSTKEIFSRFSLETYGIQALGFDEIPLDVTSNSFFNGNIVLYGKHGATTKLDKIYPIITGKSFSEILEEETVTSTFNEKAPKTIRKGDEISISSYIDTTNNYIFFYRDKDGNKYEISGSTFKIEETGSYRLYYSDGENLCAEMGIFVEDFSEEVSSWIKDNNIVFYGLKGIDENYSIQLDKGKKSDVIPSIYSSTNELSYMGFDGMYGAGDYLALEFTGKNLPMISFFNKEISTNPCDGKFGFTVNLSKYSKNTGKELTVHAPYKVFHFEGDGNLDDKTTSSRLLQRKGENGNPFVGSQESLQDEVKYGLLIGFSSANRNKTVLDLIIIDLGTKEIVTNISQPMDYQIYQYDNHQRYTHITGEFIGGITIYGFYDEELTLDKVYPIIENTSFASACANTFGTIKNFNIKYKSNMDENGRIVIEGGSIGYGGNYTGPNEGNLIDQGYISFVGNYSFNDFIAFDFTGKNMPEIAFFANNYDNSIYYGDGGKEGVVVVSGVTLWDGTNNNQILNGSTHVGIYGPYMTYIQDANMKGGSLSDSRSSHLARANLVDGKKYRIIIGFTQNSEKSMTLRYKLVDLESFTLIEDVQITTYEVFNNANYLGENVTTSSLAGSIVLYGKFRATTTIDKFLGIYEDTTIDEVYKEVVEDEKN